MISCTSKSTQATQNAYKGLQSNIIQKLFSSHFHWRMLSRPVMPCEATLPDSGDDEGQALVCVVNINLAEVDDKQCCR